MSLLSSLISKQECGTLEDAKEKLERKRKYGEQNCDSSMTGMVRRGDLRAACAGVSKTVESEIVSLH